MEMHKSRYASDEERGEGVKEGGFPPLATTNQGRLGAWSCMATGLLAVLSSGRAESAGCIAAVVEVALAGWVVGTRGCVSSCKGTVRVA